ncbi:C2H2-type zinc binding domain-containing protein spindle-F [Anticarsia gemmatalis]|uniref:C2H2-type zinc binding domain-containing protein spindle-F n=1 Tax=Anticarsia gemmatalis TaxID=129554 RepID=UPI003F75ED86
MDSSSIVSFNNDSTFQTTLKGDISVHELALHAMRDRCLLLQRRINTLETDNMRLKLDVVKATECSPYIPIKEDEKLALHQKIAELNKQKSKLMHHVFMVQCENKNLWNKIASLKGPDKSTSKDYTKQPLIRTNTYIHSTPKNSANYQEKYSESSLEEISLKLINSYIQEKSQLVEQYEQMAQLQDIDDDMLNVDSIGFTYMEDPATDSLKEIRCQTEKLNNLKKELGQQENHLKLIISRVETVLRDGYKCPTCIANNAKIVTSEHKEIETSDSLANWATPVDSSTYNNNFSELNTSAYKKSILEESVKEVTDEPKICPMCGQTFHKEVAFSEFQAHVENHFLGDAEPDSITDNYENLPSSFDNMI